MRCLPEIEWQATNPHERKEGRLFVPNRSHHGLNFNAALMHKITMENVTTKDAETAEHASSREMVRRVLSEVMKRFILEIEVELENQFVKHKTERRQNGSPKQGRSIQPRTASRSQCTGISEKRPEHWTTIWVK